MGGPIPFTNYVLMIDLICVEQQTSDLKNPIDDPNDVKNLYLNNLTLFLQLIHELFSSHLHKLMVGLIINNHRFQFVLP